MSTVPRNPTDSAPAQATVLPAARDHLDEAVRRFEAAAEALGVERPAPAELRRLCGQVAAFTAELFPGEMTVEMRVDPEIPDDLYLVFEVDCTGSVDQIVARDEQWHRRLGSLARKWPGLFCLSVYAR